MNGYYWGTFGFMVLQLITAVGRIYVRLFLVRNWGWDDWAMLGTLILATAFDAQVIAVAHTSRMEGLAELFIYHHDDLYTSARLVLSIDVTYIAAATALKVALALLLLRVLLAKWQRITIFVTLGITLVYGLFYFLLILFECGAPTNFANHVITEGFCISQSLILGTSYVHAIVNAAADCVFAFLPVHFIYKSNLNLRSKLSVGAILILGSVGSVCTLIRIGWIHYLVSIIENYFVSAQGIAIMSAAELSIGLTCICLATYKPLVHRALGLRSDYQYYNDTENHYCTRPTSDVSQMRDLSRENATGSTEPTLRQNEWPLKSIALEEEVEVDSSRSPTEKSTFSEATDAAPGEDWESDHSREIRLPAETAAPTRRSHWEEQRATSPRAQQGIGGYARDRGSRNYGSKRHSQMSEEGRTQGRSSRNSRLTPDAAARLDAMDDAAVSQEHLTALPKSPPKPQGRWHR